MGGPCPPTFTHHAEDSAISELRPYQLAAVAAVHRSIDESKTSRPCVVLPTGAGKTHVLVQLCDDYASAGRRVMCVTHSAQLVVQAADKLKAISPHLDVGIYSASAKSRDVTSKVLVCGIQSIYRRGLELCGCDPFDLVIIDEAHRIPPESEGMYGRMLDDLAAANPCVRVIGLTATPYRLEGGFIASHGNTLTDVCYEAGTVDLIEQGFLCPLVGVPAEGQVDVSGVRVSRGEFLSKELDRAFADDGVVGSAVDELLARTVDRHRVLIFCAGIRHAEKAKSLIVDAGHACGLVSSRHDNRQDVLDDFSSGRTRYCINVNCLTEGYDQPDIDAVVLLRATMSPGLYVQMLGRGLRLSDGKKDCLVLDFGGNIDRHGPVNAVNPPKGRIASRSGDKRGDDNVYEDIGVVCAECFADMSATDTVCGACGHEVEVEAPHTGEATKSDPMGSPSTQVRRIYSVEYYPHRKRGADDDAPRTLRVEYDIGMRDTVKEWVCVEHDGWAARRAQQWWSARGGDTMPRDADEAARAAYALRVPSGVVVNVNKSTGFQEISRFDWVIHPEPTAMRRDTSFSDGLPF